MLAGVELNKGSLNWPWAILLVHSREDGNMLYRDYQPRHLGWACMAIPRGPKL